MIIAKKACTLGYCGALEKFNEKGFCNKIIEIPFQPDYNICKLKVLHEGADVIVVYDIVTHFKISEAVIDILKGPQDIWIDVQLKVKNKNGKVFATIERTLKADRFTSKYKLKGKYKVKHMSPPVDDHVLCDFKIKSVCMVDPVPGG